MNARKVSSASKLAWQLALLLLLLVAVGAMVGSDGWAWAQWRTDIDLIRDIRLPRTLGACLAGALLGLAGALAQGLFIFDCPNKTELESLLQTDPAIKAGRLVAEIHPWYTAPIGSFSPGKPKKS